MSDPVCLYLTINESLDLQEDLVFSWAPIFLEDTFICEDLLPEVSVQSLNELLVVSDTSDFILGYSLDLEESIEIDLDSGDERPISCTSEDTLDFYEDQVHTLILDRLLEDSIDFSDLLATSFYQLISEALDTTDAILLWIPNFDTLEEELVLEDSPEGPCTLSEVIEDVLTNEDYSGHILSLLLIDLTKLTETSDTLVNLVELLESLLAANDNPVRETFYEFSLDDQMDTSETSENSISTVNTLIESLKLMDIAQGLKVGSLDILEVFTIQEQEIPHILGLVIDDSIDIQDTYAVKCSITSEIAEALTLTEEPT